MGTMITRTMAEQAYQYARLVYAGDMTKENAAAELSAKCGMHPSSAKIYLHNFRCLMNGKRYEYDMKIEYNIYFLDHIQQDYGDKYFRLALESLHKHLKYQKERNMPKRNLWAYWEDGMKYLSSVH